MDLRDWCGLSDAELARKDIAFVNLCAAFGLPGMGRLDVQKYLRKLDAWAEIVQRQTDAHLRKRNRFDADLSGNQFKILSMITTLQRELGVRYNREFSEGEFDARHARNVFVHGLLDGPYATCSNAPVLYAAIGRRLGYPIKLVQTGQHMFCRWDDEQERFNIEAACVGYKSEPDDYYFRFPFPVRQRHVERFQLLKSLSAREELASFIVKRGHCFMDNLLSVRAIECYAYAYTQAPENEAYGSCWACSVLMHRLMEDLRGQAEAGCRMAKLRLPTAGKAWEKRYAEDAMNSVIRILMNRGVMPLVGIG